MLHHVMIAEPKKKKKDTTSFLEKTQPIKSHRFFVNYRPTSQIVFSLYKSISLPCLAGTSMEFIMVADPKF